MKFPVNPLSLLAVSGMLRGATASLHTGASPAPTAATASTMAGMPPLTGMDKSPLVSTTLHQKGSREFLAGWLPHAMTTRPDRTPVSNRLAQSTATWKSDLAGESDTAASPAGSTARFPAAPGFEEAYAYACLQDPGAYEFATVLLNRMDTIIGRMHAQAGMPEHPDGASLTAKTRALMNPVLGGQDAPQMAAAFAEKNRLNEEVLQLGSAMNRRYAEVYGESPLEIGTSGRDPVQIQKVIAASSAQEGIELRQKMSLIHHIMEWFPHEVQRAAGVETFESSAALKQAQATMSEQDKQLRHDKVRAYIETLKLDFPVSAEKMADFCQWWMLSDTVRASYHTLHEEKTPHGRKMNSVFFEQREDVRDFLDRTPWQRLPLEPNRTVNLAMADADFPQFVQNASLHNYQPKYEQVQTDLLNGSCYFVLNEQRDWYQKNFRNENLIVETGPSGTEDIFQRLADIFEMPMKMKINGVKAASAHMHLDDHHSLHEIFSATDGNPALDALLHYDGTLASLERLDPDTFAIAKALQPHFVALEVEKRNRLERHRRAVFASAENDAAPSGDMVDAARAAEA